MSGSRVFVTQTKKKTSTGQTPLMLLCEGTKTFNSDDEEAFKLLSSNGSDVMLPDDCDGLNHTQSIFKLILQHGGNPNQKSKGGITPLMLAADVNNTSAIKTLIEHGADRDLVDDKGNNSIYYASHYKESSAVLCCDYRPRRYPASLWYIFFS